MTEYQINIIHTEQGVNMGDHGQDVIRAVPVDDSMTIRELVQQALMQRQWDKTLKPQRDSYLTIRLAVPVDES